MFGQYRRAGKEPAYLSGVLERLLADSSHRRLSANDPKLSSVGSGMLLDAVQSGWTAALRVDGAGLARVRLSEKAPAPAAHCEVFHGPVCGRSRRRS